MKFRSNSATKLGESGVEHQSDRLLTNRQDGVVSNKLLVVSKNEILFRQIAEGLGSVRSFRARNTAEAQELLKSHSICKALVECQTQDCPCIDVVAWMREAHPEVVSVVLGESNGSDYVAAVFKAGAKGFLVKPMSLDVLFHHLEGWCMGLVPISSCVREKLTSSFAQSIAKVKNWTVDVRFEPKISLTTRESEVLHLMVEGKNTKNIAAQLGVAPSTVATFIKKIYRKMNASSRAEVICAAIKKSIVASAEDGQRLLGNEPHSGLGGGKTMTIRGQYKNRRKGDCRR